LRDIRSRVADLAAETVASSRAQFGDCLRAEIANYRKPVIANGISVT